MCYTPAARQPCRPRFDGDSMPGSSGRRPGNRLSPEAPPRQLDAVETFTSSIRSRRWPNPRRLASLAPSARTPLKSNRLWSRVSWPVSILLFAVPVALALFTFLMPRLSASPEVAVRVTDRYTGQQISGATLVLGRRRGEHRARWDGDGRTLERQLSGDDQAPGYEADHDDAVSRRIAGLAGRASAQCLAGQIGRRRNLGWDRRQQRLLVIAPDGTEQATTHGCRRAIRVRVRARGRNNSILVGRPWNCRGAGRPREPRSI